MAIGVSILSRALKYYVYEVILHHHRGIYIIKSRNVFCLLSRALKDNVYEVILHHHRGIYILSRALMYSVYEVIFIVYIYAPLFALCSSILSPWSLPPALGPVPRAIYIYLYVYVYIFLFV
jgi:hypothetical protein